MHLFCTFYYIFSKDNQKPPDYPKEPPTSAYGFFMSKKKEQIRLQNPQMTSVLPIYYIFLIVPVNIRICYKHFLKTETNILKGWTNVQGPEREEKGEIWKAG